jgi:hypothetical protein
VLGSGTISETDRVAADGLSQGIPVT